MKDRTHSAVDEYLTTEIHLPSSRSPHHQHFLPSIYVEASKLHHHPASSHRRCCITCSALCMRRRYDGGPAYTAPEQGQGRAGRPPQVVTTIECIVVVRRPRVGSASPRENNDRELGHVCINEGENHWDGCQLTRHDISARQCSTRLGMGRRLPYEQSSEHWKRARVSGI
jgi:hypothetical protein